MHSASIEPPFDADVHAFYRDVLTTLKRASVPYLLGGGYAMRHWTGVARDSKDLDLFVRPQDAPRALEVMHEGGYLTTTPFPHWLSKIYDHELYVDVIYNSGNGVTKVDDQWFECAAEGRFLGVPVPICPAEETLWSKAFVIERERCDVADVAHLLRARAEHLDWPRLLARFGPHGRVLLAHLVLFGFIYPNEAWKIPDDVLDRLYASLRHEEPPTIEDLCQGPLLSREQFLVDLEHWGYKDARIEYGIMRPSQVDLWTAAIADSRAR